MRTQHFNIFNTGTESFFTPGTQLASIARVKPDAPAVIYVSPENKESVMTWRELHELSNRIAWYLLGQGIGPGKSVLAALPNIPTHIALAFGIWKTGACYVPETTRNSCPNSDFGLPRRRGREYRDAHCGSDIASPRCRGYGFSGKRATMRLVGVYWPALR